MSSEHEAVEHEAVADSRSEVRRAELADTYRGPGDFGIGGGGFVPTTLVAAPPPRRAAVQRPYVHLEDLYADFKIGGGEYILRVDRDKPRTYNGMPVSGYILDLHEQLTAQQFAERFGGGEYTVYVRTFIKDASDSDGSPKQRTVAQVEVQIPGPPNLVGRGVAERTGAGMSNNVMGFDPRVQIEYAKLQDQREIRREAEQPRLVTTLDEMSARRVEESSRAFRERIEDLRKELDKLAAQRDARVEECNQLRRAAADAERDFHYRITARDTEKEQELRNKHTDEMVRVREDHRRALDDQRAQFESRIEAARRDHEQRLEVIRTDHNKEMQRVLEQERNERLRVSTDAAREQARMQENAANQMAAVQRELERVRAEGHERHRDALAQAQLSHGQTLVFTEKTLIMQIESLRTDNARLASELSTTKTERDRMVREAYKPAVKQIQEAQMLLEAVGGGKDDPPEAPPATWQGALMEVGKNILPTLLQGMGPRPPAGMVQPHQMQPHPGGAPQLPPIQQRPGQRPQQPHSGLPQHPQPARPGPRPRPRWMVPAGPPAPGQALNIPPGADGPILGSARPSRIPAGGAVMSQQTAPPLSGEPQSMSTLVTPLQPVLEVPPQPQPQPQPQLQSQPSQQQVVQPSQEEVAQMSQIDEAFARVHEAIVNGEPPQSFAQRFVAQIGQPAAVAVIRSVTPDQVIEGVTNSAAGAESVLPTMEGRQYLVDLWQEVANITGG